MSDASNISEQSLDNRLLDNHRAFLRYLEGQVGDRAVAEDVLQDAFVKVIATPDAAPDDESIVPWFYQTLRNAVIDRYWRAGSANRAMEAFARELELRQSETSEIKREICACVSRLAARSSLNARKRCRLLKQMASL